MRNVTLEQIFEHPVTQKYVKRAGLAHAIATSYHAFRLAEKNGVNPDLAVKAAFLHDMGHYTWYRDGEWDFDLYKENDIHAIKGAERAHKLLIRLGEDPRHAKEIALAVLLHTDSFLPVEHEQLNLSTLQQIVALADELDEEPSGQHHYRSISEAKARKKIVELDNRVDETLREKIHHQTNEV
ncbi:HD domain-containing protein [Salibacterium salarium]|uniref:HD domain-containing protein n=1 Tax=Salibacterium salarium TaxID=284579 RepID=A0A3R9Q0J8_9BACI|nr:HD domain-containing protein [Salibacterium salarium]RSL31037.1 HD domain-containing protein [Salibacterium salarium]